MSDLSSLPDSPSAIFLQASGCGVLPCVRQDGPTTDRCGWMSELEHYDGAPDIERAWREGLMPDPLLTVSEWADLHRVLGTKESGEPGRWRTSRTPYLRQIMDCLSPASPVERVVFMKGAQVGGTELGLNWIGYAIHHAPGARFYWSRLRRLPGPASLSGSMGRATSVATSCPARIAIMGSGCGSSGCDGRRGRLKRRPMSANPARHRLPSITRRGCWNRGNGGRRQQVAVAPPDSISRRSTARGEAGSRSARRGNRPRGQRTNRWP